VNAPPTGLRLAAAIGSAALLAGGIVLLGWSNFTVLAFYWLENVIVGAFTAVRILAAGWRSARYAESLATAVFFGLHYGLFCLVHGTFVALLFGGARVADSPADPVLLMLGRIAGDGAGVVVIAAMVVAAALDAWQAMQRVDAEDPRLIRRIAAEPYGRVVVLHLVLIAGAGIMAGLQLPSAAALLLVAFRLVYELRLLRRGRAPAGPARRGAA
jgi:hypothetical protein